MSKFHAGDLVIGTKAANSQYCITNEGWIGEVLSVDRTDENCIEVQGVFESESYHGHVDATYFDMYRATPRVSSRSIARTLHKALKEITSESISNLF